MYHLTGKASNHGEHAVVNISVQYGRGKHQEVYLVNKMDFPTRDVASMVSAATDDHRFFTSRVLAESAANTAEREGKQVKDLRANLKGKNLPGHRALIANRVGDFPCMHFP